MSSIDHVDELEVSETHIKYDTNALLRLLWQELNANIHTYVHACTHKHRSV